jgi:hypothetical protein
MCCQYVWEIKVSGVRGIGAGWIRQGYRVEGVRFREKRTAEYRIMNIELRRKEFCRLFSVL